MRSDGFISNSTAKNFKSETSHQFENLGKGTDGDIKVEKALIEFNEI